MKVKGLYHSQHHTIPYYMKERRCIGWLYEGKATAHPPINLLMEGCCPFLSTLVKNFRISRVNDVGNIGGYKKIKNVFHSLLLEAAQLFEKASRRNIKLTYGTFNMQWYFDSDLYFTT